MEIIGILYFLFLGINVVSGFLVQTGSTGISNTQTNDDRTVQNLLNLIVNEQNSRLQLQNIVTTLTNRLDQLENAQEQMQKTSDAKINQTENDMVKKLNEMSARLIQLEKFNADVSRQLVKEKNNREQLEKMFTALEKRVNNSTTTNGANIKTSEILRIETTLNNMTNVLTEKLNNLTNVDLNLVNLTHHYEGAQTEMKALEIKLYNMTNSNNYMQDKLLVTEAKLNNLTNLFVNLTNRYDGTQTEMKELDLKLLNMTNANNYMQDTLKQLIKNVSLNGNSLSNLDKSVGFSVYAADQSSASGNRDPLKYKTLIYNTGNEYDMSTGVFTCEYPGLYFFTATMFRTPGTHESFCYFYLNNQRYSPVNSGAGAQEAYMSGTQAIVYLLTVGDRVYLSSCAGVSYMTIHSSFSGFLISN